MTIRCQACGRILRSDDEIEEHEHEVILALEHAGAGFECPICHEEYDTAENLVVHESLHTTDA
jgi:CRISPR/Cas system-associated protein Cas10 (large subunit of type III CRISPR-Cas system)